MAFLLIVPIITSAQADVDTSGGSSCAVLTVNLKYGMRDTNANGNSVSVLQDFLYSHGYLSLQPTGFFGSMTRSAAAAFQSDNNISATPPGYVGSLTRAKIQAIDCNTNTSPTTSIPLNSAPTITSIEAKAAPAAGILYIGEKAYIHGTGLGGRVSMMVGQTPASVMYNTDTYAEFYVLSLPAGPQVVVIKNDFGESNKYNVTLVSPTPTSKINVISPQAGESWTVGSMARISWQPFTNTGLDTFVYLNGGGNAEGYSKYIGSMASGSSFNYLVTTSDLPVSPGYQWRVLVCKGMLENGGNNCGTSGAFYVTNPNQTSFSVGVDSSSPGLTTVEGGTNGVTMGVIKVRSTKDIRLTKLSLTLTSGLYGDINQIYLYQGSTQIGTGVFNQGATTATITLFTPQTISANTDTLITIKADTSKIGPGYTGKDIELVALDPLSAEATDISSGLVVQANPVTGGVAGVRVVMRSAPSVVLDSLSSNGLEDGRLMRFKITSNSASDVGIYKLTISLATPIFSSGGSISGVKVYAYTDPSYTSPVSGSIGDGVGQFGSGSVTPSANNTTMIFTATNNPLEIPGGATRYFEVRAAGVSSPVTTYVTATLAGDSTYTPGMSTATGVAGNFIWSPNTNGTSGFQTSDWKNGYGLQVQTSQTRSISGSVTTPSISSISPTSGSGGETVTIYGNNLTSVTSVDIIPKVLDSTKSAHSSMTNFTVSPDGTTISFVLSSIITANTSPGAYLIYVSKSNVVSNTVDFTINPLNSTPTITSISPSSGAVGAIVTIYGSGFATNSTPIGVSMSGNGMNSISGNTINFGRGVIKGALSTNGTSLTFTVPAGMTPACRFGNPQCAFPDSAVTPGDYDVSVTNINGSSNVVTYTVGLAVASNSTTNNLQTTQQLASALESIRLLVEQLSQSLK